MNDRSYAEIEIVNVVEIPSQYTDFSAKNARTLAARVPHCHSVRTGDVDRGPFSIGMALCCSSGSAFALVSQLQNPYRAWKCGLE
jgi:hypothetical protein